MRVHPVAQFSISVINPDRNVRESNDSQTPSEGTGQLIRFLKTSLSHLVHFAACKRGYNRSTYIVPSVPAGGVLARGAPWLQGLSPGQASRAHVRPASRECIHWADFCKRLAEITSMRHRHQAHTVCVGRREEDRRMVTRRPHQPCRES